MLERKKITLGPEACAALAAVVRMIVGAELGRRLEMTRGLFAVLRGYNLVYHDAVRRAGRLTFADVQRLLLPAAGAPELSGGGAGEGRLLIDWRLDAQFDHWLLDEFQDTSFAQWSILRNLLDEAVQDAEQRRSLFYRRRREAGHLCLREGDPRLFREIFHHYNGALAEEHLTSSYRSGPAVIAMVNRVFGDAAAVRALVPADAAERWTREWRPHTTAKSALGGYAELRHAEDEAGRFAETLRILQEIEPGRRGLSVAVIVQKNDTGARLADYLRREGNLAAVAESDLHIATDNPLTCAVLALLRVAAHPGDTLAREHLAMTPWAAGLAAGDALTGRLLRELQADGFAATIERCLRAVEPHLAGTDQFSRLRGRQLVAAAQEYDEDGRRDVGEFLAWAESYTVREADTAGVVRVLTVHKAKGLGFDPGHPARAGGADPGAAPRRAGGAEGGGSLGGMGAGSAGQTVSGTRCGAERASGGQGSRRGLRGVVQILRRPDPGQAGDVSHHQAGGDVGLAEFSEAAGADPGRNLGGGRSGLVRDAGSGENHRPGARGFGASRQIGDRAGAAIGFAPAVGRQARGAARDALRTGRFGRGGLRHAGPRVVRDRGMVGGCAKGDLAGGAADGRGRRGRPSRRS